MSYGVCNEGGAFGWGLVAGCVATLIFLGIMFSKIDGTKATDYMTDKGYSDIIFTNKTIRDKCESPGTYSPWRSEVIYNKDGERKTGTLCTTHILLED